MSSNFTGFNAFSIRESIKTVGDSFSGLIDILYNDMQSQFVNGMAEVWACKHAQDFFRNIFKPNIDSLIENINNVFENITISMNDAGVRWATTTGEVSAFVRVPFARRIVRIDVDPIKENMNGERGIDVVIAQSVLSRLDNIKMKSISELNGVKNCVNNSGFLGGTQQNDLNDAIINVRNKVIKTIENIIFEIRNAIGNTVDNYGDMAGKISSIFASIPNDSFGNNAETIALMGDEIYDFFS